jgi:signal transduction histidine kinase
MSGEPVLPQPPGPAITAFPRVGVNRPTQSGADRVLRTVLCTITPLITGANDRRFMQELMPDLKELFMASRCSIMLLETPGDIGSLLYLEAHSGLPETAVRKKHHAGGVAAQVLRQGQPTLIVDADGTFDSRFAGIAPRRDLGSSLCAPIATPQGSVFGILNIARSGATAAEALTSRDLEVCDAIAMLIGDSLERLQSRDAERELRERVRAVEHLSMLGEVAAGIAHEIANPLASVRSNIVALNEYLADLAPFFTTASGEAATMIADLPALMTEVQEGMSRIDEIIDNMKSMVRTHRDEHLDDVLCVADIMHSVARLVRTRLRAAMVIDVDPSVHVLGRGIDLTQILMNLIINGGDACEERARTDTARAGVPPEVRVTAGVVGDEVRIDVIDNGTGISEENLVKVFQPLFSTKGGKGTGLGLSICKRLTESLSGRLEVESTVGRGTTFRLWLRRGMLSSAPAEAPDQA